MKVAITSGLIIGMAVFILYNLIKLAIYGEVLIKEPNGFILIADIVFLLCVTGYGVYLFVEGVRRE